MAEILLTILIAAATGFSAGMFGIGGSVIASPLLDLALGLPAIVALATPLPSAIVSAASGSLKYTASGMIDFRLAELTVLTAVPFGVASSSATVYIEGEYLIIAKAGLLIYLGWRYLYPWKKIRENGGRHRSSVWLPLAVGAAAGIISGLLAVGGGVVFVAAFNKLLRMPMKQSVATSLLCVGVAALANSLTHLSHGHIDPETALMLMIMAWPFAIIGAQKAIDLKNQTLERTFGWAMIAFAAYFIIYQLIS
jgi:uncharacterized membrane protein YfcA